MYGLGVLGKVLILLGVLLTVMGLLFVVGEKIPWLGKLPGDLLIKRDRVTIYIPFTTSILISILLSLLLVLFRK